MDLHVNNKTVRLFNIMLIVVIFIFVLLLSSCGKNKLIGRKKVKLELGDEYVEEGLNLEDGYTYVPYSNLINNMEGEYEIEYKIYDENGKYISSLYRKIIVKDKTAPIYEEIKRDRLYVGRAYNVSSFIKNIKDANDYEISPNNEIIYFQTGDVTIHYVIKDASNNEAIYDKKYNKVRDAKSMIEEMEKEGLIEHSTSTIIHISDEYAFTVSTEGLNKRYVLSYNNKNKDHKNEYISYNVKVSSSNTITTSVSSSYCREFSYSGYEWDEEYMDTKVQIKNEEEQANFKAKMYEINFLFQLYFEAYEG